MRLPIYQVDTFTDKLFSGNPAAVCPLQTWLPDSTMQAIAAENNLAETAFFVPEEGGYALRWFTPTVEVDLCGHATLAAAHVVFHFLKPALETISFRTMEAGTLSVSQRGGLLVMDFPVRRAVAVEAAPNLIAALGGKPREVLRAHDYLVVYSSAADVKMLKPDFVALAEVDCTAVIVTAPGDNGVDFVSRFFAPRQGIPEDQVTGSAHCTLVPFWAERLGKNELEAWQVSLRGGKLRCTLQGERIGLAGHAVLYLQGQILV